MLEFRHFLASVGYVTMRGTARGKRMFPQAPGSLTFCTHGSGILLLYLAIWSVLLFSLEVNAAVFRVTSEVDSTQPQSLRGAILEANRLGGANFILMEARTNLLSLRGADTGDGRSGELVIATGRMALVGAVAGVTVRWEGFPSRIIHILPGAYVTLRDVTIAGGCSTTGLGPDGPPGGGLLNEGSLLLRDCVISDNVAGAGGFGYGGGGGGIYNAGNLVMQRCLVCENTAGASAFFAGGSGGGIYNSSLGFAVILGSIFKGNVAGSGGVDFSGFGGDGGAGGAIYNLGAMAMSGCTLKGNLAGRGADGTYPDPFGILDPASDGGASGNGAGVYNAGRLRIVHSTIDGNRCPDGGNGGSLGTGGQGAAGGNGGGIYNVGVVSLESSLITSNSCGNGGVGGYGCGRGGGGDGGDGGSGGGIYNTQDASVTITACTITSNAAGSGGDAGNGEVIGISAVPSSGGTGGSGGGLLNAPGGSAKLFGRTLVTGNSAGQGGQPGSVLILFAPQTTNLVGSAGADGVWPDIFGSVFRR